MPSRMALELAALHDDEFEQLVFAFVAAEHPEIDWRRVTLIRAPDGGVDVMLIGERDGRRVGWQAKHSQEPHWTNWEHSLDSAATEHSIAEMTFVFPFNPTAGQLETFENRLRGRHERVEVESWTLAHLEDLCRKHPKVYERYLGANQADLAVQIDRLDRTIRAGGKIEGGADLLERLQAISDQLDAKDPNFAVRVDAGASATPSPEWSVPPYISLAFAVEGREVVIAFWTRAESPVDRPYFGFTDDDAGRAARAHARAELGHGRAVTLREGIWIGITSPLIIKDLSEQGIVLPGFDTGRVEMPTDREGGLRIEPGEPVQIDLVADPGGVASQRRLTARPVLPEEPAKSEVVAAQDGITLSLGFRPRDDGGVDYTLTCGWSLDGGDAATLAASAEWLLTGLDQGLSLVLGGMPLEAKGTAPTDDGARLRQTVSDSLTFLNDVHLIEERTGMALPVPPTGALTENDLAAVQTAAEILRTGRGTATFERGNGRVQAAEIGEIADRMSGSEVVRDVEYVIFGRTVSLGPGRYTLPKLKLSDVVALGPEPFSPARVWIEAADDELMEFVLV